MFEAKTYNDVRNTIGAANCLFAVAFILSCYGAVITPDHAKLVVDLLGRAKLNPLISGLVGIALLSAFWAYVSTVVLRLHDRLYEPILVKWRATYTADFILRALCFKYSHLVSPRLFEEAYDDAEKCRTFVARLFYRFVGDETKDHLATLTFFYTDIRNYWLLVLAEIYCLLFLVSAAGYWWFFPPIGRSSYRVFLAAVLLAIGFRIWANRYLDKPRRITRDQIGLVLRDHREDFEKELSALVDEFNLRASK